MNDQCHDCKIRKLCYLEEPEEDWTCDHYEPCEYDEEDVIDINVGGKDTISRKAAIEALTKDKKALEHIINGMSGYEKEFERLLYQRNQVDYDIYAIEQLPPSQPEQLGTNLAEVGTDLISRQAAIDLLKQMRKDGDMIPWEGKDVFARIRKLPPSQPEIIRCRNCKFASGDSRICMKFDHSPIGELDFCAWAERRTDEE